MNPTGLQLALLGGVLLAGGLVLLVSRLAPARPDLADALDRLSPDPHRTALPVVEGVSAADRVGRWGVRLFPMVVWGRAPVQRVRQGRPRRGKSRHQQHQPGRQQHTAEERELESGGVHRVASFRARSPRNRGNGRPAAICRIHTNTPA